MKISYLTQIQRVFHYRNSWKSDILKCVLSCWLNGIVNGCLFDSYLARSVTRAEAVPLCCGPLKPWLINKSAGNTQLYVQWA